MRAFVRPPNDIYGVVAHKSCCLLIIQTPLSKPRTPNKCWQKRGQIDAPRIHGIMSMLITTSTLMLMSMFMSILSEDFAGPPNHSTSSRSKGRSRRRIRTWQDFFAISKKSADAISLSAHAKITHHFCSPLDDVIHFFLSPCYESLELIRWFKNLMLVNWLQQIQSL